MFSLDFFSCACRLNKRQDKNPSEWMNEWIEEWQRKMSRSRSIKCLFGDIIHQCELFSIFIISSRYRKCKQLKETSTSTNRSWISHGTKMFLSTHKSSWQALGENEGKCSSSECRTVLLFWVLCCAVLWVGGWIKLRVSFAIQDTHNNNFECVI